MASASNIYLQSRFSSLVRYCLDNDLVRSATFYAERFFHVDTTHHDARHLLTEAYLRAGQTHTALHLVNVPGVNTCSKCHELIAKCCTALGRYETAREAYEFARIHSASSRPNAVHNPVVFSDEALLHLKAGDAALKGNHKDQALESFRKALKLNPLLWEAFEGLCAVGSFPDVNEIMPPRPRLPGFRGDESSMFISLNSRGSLPTATGAGFFTPDASMQSTNVLRAWRPDHGIAQPFRINNLGNRDSISTADMSFSGIADNSMQFATSSMRGMSPPAMGTSASLGSHSRFNDDTGPAPKKARNSHNTENAGVIQAGKARMNGSAIADVFSSRVNQASSRAPKSSREPERRSTRIRTSVSSTAAKPTNVKHPPPARDRRRGKGRAGSRSLGSDDDSMALADGVAASPTTSSLAHSPRSEASPAPSAQGFDAAAQEALEWQAADDYIYELMRIFAMATRAMAQYQCQDVLQHLDVLPGEQRRSPGALSLNALAHYEMVDYVQAERAFTYLRKVQPYRTWDMEVYSTLLWHLRRNVQLSFLSQELLSIDSRSPQAWIAAGNCFSLHRERSQAMTCFRRAAQLDPRCAYAHTLSGHESIDEDTEKAMAFFQSAIRADPRHYNAWYGLGNCYMSMNKQRQAEYHFRRASDIHPANAVLLGCIGVVVERRGATDEALVHFDRAIQLCPDNPLVLYRRAKLLMGLRRYQEALKDLVRLRDLAPEESNVVFQLAKLYRLMGDDVRAAQHLAMARDISPKSLGKIKKLMAVERDSETSFDMDESLG